MALTAIDFIHSEINKLKQQRLTPKYIQLNTKAMTDVYIYLNKHRLDAPTFPETYQGLTLLYNPQQTTWIRVLCDVKHDFLQRKETSI